jgi:tRNA G46 methylase TrmB
MDKNSKAPSHCEDFNRACKAPLTFLGDIRIPDELEALVKSNNPKTFLELGCGTGRFSALRAAQKISTPEFPYM